MFDLPAMLLSSVASFLFPIFASYKALKSSDPAQLTPWLMYWVVFSCFILAESWVSFILYWIPFYGYARLLFLLYLILPQTQGARLIYEEHIHPFLEDNEGHIDEFIASAHDRLKAAGVAYFKQAIEYLRVNVLGLPPSDPAPPTPEPSAAAAGPQSYTSSLLARFSVPTVKWASAATGANPGTDFYNMLAGAVSAATGVAARGSNMTATGSNLIPPNLRDSGEKMTFISAQRERLNVLLSALDNEARELQKQEATRGGGGHHTDDEEPTQRPPSGLSAWSGLSKSRSETDFEKIDANSASEDENTLRRRNPSSAGSTGGGWMTWPWGSEGPGGGEGQQNQQQQHQQ
ncbi:hypothetical protein N3K66_004766 [Trichothecium roseum]|uniref:Uncharacterized protein n=1 Tax=Trichothecium roseum TaxID=47278 RepID=A0ACC0V233_9HYPO|nr:hypothetical protein N3K66_004766 [Trichothecium roseum]